MPKNILWCFYLDGINFGGEDHQLSVHRGKNFHMIREKRVITLCLNTGKSVWQKLLILLGNNQCIIFNSTGCRYSYNVIYYNIFFCSRWKLWKYKKTFTGSELVTWLVENNICSSRDDALGYAIKLWNGQVLRHLNCTEHFQDASNILYTFNRR